MIHLCRGQKLGCLQGPEVGMLRADIVDNQRYQHREGLVISESRRGNAETEVIPYVGLEVTSL